MVKLSGKTHQAELSKKLKDIKKDKIVFGGLGLIVQPNNI